MKEHVILISYQEDRQITLLWQDLGADSSLTGSFLAGVPSRVSRLVQHLRY